jgi:hypothetical protein
VELYTGSGGHHVVCKVMLHAVVCLIIHFADGNALFCDQQFMIVNDHSVILTACGCVQYSDFSDAHARALF